MDTRQQIVVGVAVAVIGALATSFSTGVWDWLSSEKPPSCPGTDCDGRNPQTTTCGNDAGTYSPGAAANPASLQIRYSQRCRSVWGRILAGEVGDRVTVRVGDGPQRSAEITENYDQFTRMIALPRGDYRVKVCAVAGTGPSHKGTWKTYCIEADQDTAWQ
jgi:hypothetical protein